MRSGAKKGKLGFPAEAFPWENPRPNAASALALLWRGDRLLGPDNAWPKVDVARGAGLRGRRRVRRR